MDITRAISIIKQYGNDLGITDTLEILKEMDNAFEDLWEHQKNAFRVFMYHGKQLFAEKESA